MSEPHPYSAEEDRKHHKIEEKSRRKRQDRLDQFEPRPYYKKDERYARRLTDGFRMLGDAS